MRIRMEKTMNDLDARGSRGNQESEMKKQRCEMCRFCIKTDVPQSPTVKFYSCHRHTPSPYLARAVAVWPSVQKDDWCGEFQKSEEEK